MMRLSLGMYIPLKGAPEQRWGGVCHACRAPLETSPFRWWAAIRVQAHNLWHHRLR